MLSTRQYVLLSDIWAQASDDHEIHSRTMAKTHKRKREVVMARQAAFYDMIRQGFTTSQIIVFLGSEFQAVVDHSSIVTAVRREADRRGESYGRNILREMKAERLDAEGVEK